MIFDKKIGVVSYGAYLPKFTVSAEEIGHGEGTNGLGVMQKTVADLDEDTTTLAVEASQQALARLSGKEKVGCLFVGSESHVYAVKPTGTMVAQALGLSENISVADLQFACKAGTQALQIGLTYLQSGAVTQALAIGADTAQARPKDALEYTAAAGGAAFVLGQESPQTPLLARVLASTSVATDTPDFWRRSKQAYPEHGGRFTGDPAYFAHVIKATQLLLAEVKLTPNDIQYCAFHTPNAKFPQRVAKKLGFSKKQLEIGLVVSQIGNTYAGASLLALIAVLDQAKAHEKILVTSYGSGAGADSFLLEVTDQLPKLRQSWNYFLENQLARCEPTNYRAYRAMMELKE